MDALQVIPSSTATGTTYIEAIETALDPESTSVPTVRDTQSCNRPIEVLEAEILLHNGKTVENFIVIGNALNEAKKLVEPGQWLKWLSEKVYISPREAQRYMQVAEAYKNYVSTATKLGLTKALVLLKIPDDERKDFIGATYEVNGHQKTVYDMSVKELNQLIREAESKNNNAPSDEETKRKKIRNNIVSVQKSMDIIRSYLKEFAKKPDVAEEFRDSICSLNEITVECMSLINSGASASKIFPVIRKGEEL